MDVVFPVLHGPFGEDGTIQGLLELAGVPYVGAGVLACAAAMDKEFTKKLLAAEGLPVGDSSVLRPGTADARPKRNATGSGLPVFVKPARAGSSLGVSRVTDWADARRRDRRRPAHDPKVLVEAAVVGPGDRVRRAGVPDGTVARRQPPAEIRIVGGDDRSTTSTPSTWTTSRVRHPGRAADDVDRAGPGRAAAGVRRAGLRRGWPGWTSSSAADGVPVVNEVNTMPGFTPISMYPRMWAATGSTTRR